jgi:phosphoglucosamine mutase
VRYSDLAPKAFEQLGAEVETIGNEPDGTTSTSTAARPTCARCRSSSSASGLDLGVAFDGDGDRMLAVDANGDVVDGDQIVARLWRCTCTCPRSSSRR